MIFCQACGARNTDDARFCNICGTRIASTGEPGGPIVPAGADAAGARPAPKTTTQPAASTTTGGTSTTMSGSRVSLEAIGVRSSGRTYAILAAAAIALVTLGAVGTWIAMRGGGEAPAPVAEGEGEGLGGVDAGVDDEIVVGDPIPASEEMPEGVDIVTTGPRATKRGTSPRATGSGGTTGSGASTSAGSGTGTSSGTSGTGTSSGSSGTGSSGTGTSSGTGSSGTSSGTGSSGTGSSGTGSSGTGSSGASGTGSSGTSGTGASTGTGGGGETQGTGTGGSGTRDWDAMEEDAPDERDLAMEGYSTHVRRVIREFYIRRAQTCFDHESARDGEAVRGTVLIGFTIQQSGEVANTTVDRNTTGRDTLGACLARQVDQWRLPPPPAEMGDVDMQMPFSR